MTAPREGGRRWFVEANRRETAPHGPWTTAPRERAVQCQVCRADTWAVSAVCDDCTGRPSHAATTPTGYAAAVRNAGVREALYVLCYDGPAWLSQRERVVAATAVLLDSCKRQARVLP